MLSEFLGIEGFTGQMVDGALITVSLSLVSLFFGLILSILIAGMKLSGYRILAWPAEIFTTILRGLPELLVILFIFYAIPLAINDNLLIPNGYEAFIITPFVAAVIALSIDFAAYGNEVFRSVYLAFPKGQVEAARACGMSPAKTFWRIILPQLWAPAIPALSNLWMVLVKATALASAITLKETMFVADLARQVTKDPFLWYGAAAIVFLLFTFFSELAQKRLEAWANRGKRPA